MSVHAYKVGDKVVVWNQTISGRTICEGRAEIRRLVDGDDRYDVIFDSDPNDVYERVVPLDAADVPNDDPRVREAPQPPVSSGRAMSREIPNP